MTHEFTGLSPQQAKRRALNYWYLHRRELQLSVQEFFARCRVKRDGGLTRITFHADEVRAA